MTNTCVTLNNIVVVLKLKDRYFTDKNHYEKQNFRLNRL